MNVLPRQYSDNVEIDGLLSQYYWNPPANQATRWSLLSESDSSVWYAETEDLRAIARTQDLTMIDSAFSTWSYEANSENATGGNDTITAGAIQSAALSSDPATNTGDSTGLILNALAANTINGTAGNDILNGTIGDDVINGLDGNDTLNGLTGNDTLDGGMGDDYLLDFDGNNKLYGGAGNDYLYVLAGNNLLDGGDGNDILIGGMGNDILIGGAGIDQMSGGAGDDIFRISGTEALYEMSYYSPGGVINGGFIDGGDGIDTLELMSDVYLAGIDGQRNIERINGNGFAIFGTDDADNFSFWSFSNITGLNFIDGGAGDDGIYLDSGGAAWDSLIYGGAGNDTFYCFSGSNNHTFYGGTGNDTLYVSGEVSSLLDGGDGDDYLKSDSSGNCRMFGGAGNDHLDAGGWGDSLLDGGDGDDYLQGGEGDDILIGGAGIDEIYGGYGYGADVMYGGDGNDVFAFRRSSDSSLDTRDLIRDFQSGSDKLDFTWFDSDSGSAGLQGFTFIGSDDFDTGNSGGQLRFEYNASSDIGTLYGKTNGNNCDFAVDLTGVHSLINDDFIGLANAVTLSNTLSAPASIIPGSDDEPDDGGTALDDATADTGDITQYLSASPAENNTAANPGAADYASPVTPNDANASLDMLLANNQILV